MKSIYNISASLLIFALISSCSPQKQASANYDNETECAGVEGDGSQTVIAWGNGRNRFDAMEQAKKRSS